MRLFVASRLAVSDRRRLSSLSRELARTTDGLLRPVPEDSEHLTHLFLGERDDAEVPGLISALASLATSRGVGVHFGPAAVFPRRSQPRLVCLGASAGADELEALAAAVHRSLSPVVPDLPDPRRGRPHVTLARFRRRARRADALAVESRLERTGLAEWRSSQVLDSVELIRSRLSPAGARYETLARVPLDAAG